MLGASSRNLADVFLANAVHYLPHFGTRYNFALGKLAEIDMYIETWTFYSRINTMFQDRAMLLGTHSEFRMHKF